MTAGSQAGERRKYRRAPEAQRREALIAATLDAVAEAGTGGATVRNIAARAGVTAGLIRHYFASREALLQAAYARVMRMMTETSQKATEAAGIDPVARLAAYVSASLRPPVLNARMLAIWAEFQHAARGDAAMARVHHDTYLDYRDRLEALIAALPRPPASPERLRQEAIACNALIDGLWIEGSAGTAAFAPGEVEAIGLAAAGALLGVDLTGGKS